MTAAIKLRHEHRVIYTATSHPKVRHKRTRGVAASSFRGADGRWHTYLNAAVPRETGGTMDDSLCRTCDYGYSHVMTEQREVCHECTLEQAAEHAMYWQSVLGIDLGWRMPEDYQPDTVRHRNRFSYRRAIRGKI